MLSRERGRREGGRVVSERREVRGEERRVERDFFYAQGMKAAGGVRYLCLEKNQMTRCLEKRNGYVLVSVLISVTNVSKFGIWKQRSPLWDPNPYSDPSYRITSPIQLSSQTLKQIYFSHPYLSVISTSYLCPMIGNTQLHLLKYIL